MPFYLKESNALSQVDGLRSVLIVPCRFCPAASLAVREKKPYLELFRRFLRTEAYESYIEALKDRLRGEGIQTSVFDSKLLHQFVACMWTSRRRKALAKRAAEFEAVVVLGCDAMAEAVRDSVKSAGCRVIQGMEIEGLMNVLPKAGFPFNLSLELQGVTSLDKRRSVEQEGDQGRAAQARLPHGKN
jgi:hypothetical protein